MWELHESPISLELDGAAIECGFVLGPGALYLLRELDRIVTDDNQLLAYGFDRPRRRNSSVSARAAPIRLHDSIAAKATKNALAPSRSEMPSAWASGRPISEPSPRPRRPPATSERTMARAPGGR